MQRVSPARLNPDDQARAHDGLAHTHQALGRQEEAAHHWRAALAILADLGLTHVEEVDADAIRARLAPDGTDQPRL